MKILFPQNIFSNLIADSLSAQINENLHFLPSALLTSELLKSADSVGLIPTTDIIKHNELFISREYGLTFEGSMCNSYLYFNDSNRQLKEISLFGDVSSVEVVLSKILFRELYDAEVEVKILTDESKINTQNLLMVGDNNYMHNRYEKGISFAEEITEALSLPFVNYVFASTKKSSIELMNEELKGKSSIIYSNVEKSKFGHNLADEIKSYIMENISSFVMDFGDQDIEGINQTIRTPYFYGMVENIVEVNYV